MLSSYAKPSAVPAVSTHFVGESARAICFLKDAQVASDDGADACESLPLVAVGDDNALALYLPVVSSPEEDALREELDALASRKSSGRASGGVELNAVAEIAHEGDVNALRFASSSGGRPNLLFSASSSGGIHAFSVGNNGTDVLAPVESAEWKKLFVGGATSLDVSSDRATLVAASECGAVAWLRFDDNAALSAQVIRNADSSQIPLLGVKMLARESAVATVGTAPGSQLRVWDINANQNFPVAAASDPNATCVLTAVETHPTRPELLITGSDDGRVALWDLRRLDSPFRVETKHQRAVRALAIHQTSPRLLFSGGDDATVLAWDFHHNRPVSEAVEYEKYVHSHLPGAGLRVQPLVSSFLPWRTMDFHASSDTLIAGSDAQSLLLVRHASRAHHPITL